MQKARVCKFIYQNVSTEVLFFNLPSPLNAKDKCLSLEQEVFRELSRLAPLIEQIMTHRAWYIIALSLSGAFTRTSQGVLPSWVTTALSLDHSQTLPSVTCAAWHVNERAQRKQREAAEHEVISLIRKPRQPPCRAVSKFNAKGLP